MAEDEEARTLNSDVIRTMTTSLGKFKSNLIRLICSSNRNRLQLRRSHRFCSKTPSITLLRRLRAVEQEILEGQHTAKKSVASKGARRAGKGKGALAWHVRVRFGH